jgi:hypothetical protein
MFESGENLQLNPLTIHCAIHNFDRVLRTVAVERNVIQLVGLSCLLLAAKVDEVEAELPSTDDILSLAPGHTTKGVLFSMEVTLLEKLNWKLCVLTPRHFVDLYVARGCLFHNDTTSSVVMAGGGKKLDFDDSAATAADTNKMGGEETHDACADTKENISSDDANATPANSETCVASSDGVVAGITPIRKTMLGNSNKTAKAFGILTEVLCGEVVREACFLVHPPALLAAGIVWAGRVALGVSPAWRPELSGLTLESNEECVRQVGDQVFQHLNAVRPELIVQSEGARDETSSPKGVADLLLAGE